MAKYRFGKHPPKVDYRTLRFMDYLKSTLAAPPPAYDALSTVYKKLNVSDPTALFPMDANDQYGDCNNCRVGNTCRYGIQWLGWQKRYRQTSGR